jgi:hypothetical protein
MSLKLQERMNHLPLLDGLIDDDDFTLIVELGTFVKNIKKEVNHWVINYFLSFLTSYDERRAHNMLTLMLDSRFKTLKLISFSLL